MRVIPGGFGVPGFLGELRLESRLMGANLDGFKQRTATNLPDVEQASDVGCCFVGDAGIFTTRLIDRKTRRGQMVPAASGGTRPRLPASGNFSQAIRNMVEVLV